MKRYQCIKDFPPFTKGNTYPDIFGSPSHEGGADLITNDGRVYEITRTQMVEHFQELLDLHVDDHEEEQYTAMFQKPNRLSLGCAIIIAVILTVLALIFFG